MTGAASGEGTLTCTVVTRWESSAPDETGISPASDHIGQSRESVTEQRDLPCRLKRDGTGAVAAIFYTETDGAGGVTENTLELLSAKEIRLTRSGSISSVFLFSVGAATETTLRTPYGSLTLTVMTEQVATEEDSTAASLAILIRYRILENMDELHEVQYRILSD